MAQPPSPGLYTLPDDSLKMWELKKNDWDNSGKMVLYQNPQAAVQRTSIEQVYSVPATNFVAGDIKSQGPTQIRISPGIFSGYYEYAQIELDFKNTDGVNSVTLAPAPYLLNPTGNALSVSFNSSGAPIWNLPIDALYYQYAHMSPANITNALAFNQANMTATAFASPTAIPANGTAHYCIPIPMACFIGMNANVQQGDIILTINWNQSGAVVAGTGTAQLTAVNLLVTTHKNPRVDPIRNQLIDSSVYIKNTVQWTPLSSVQTLTASQSNSIPLSGLTPQVAGMMLILIRSSKAGAGMYNFSSLSNTSGQGEWNTQIDLKNPSGQSVLGQGPITGAAARSTLPLLESVGTMTTVVPMYPIYFSARPGQFIANADTSNGCIQLGQNMTLYLTPGPAFVTGTYTIDVLVLSQARLRQINKKVDLILAS